MCYRHVALPGSHWGMFIIGKKGKTKGLLSGEFREFTQGQKCLTLQSYKCGVGMLLPARDLEHQPWANLSQEFVKERWSRSILKRQRCAVNMGGMCLLLQHQGQRLRLPNCEQTHGIHHLLLWAWSCCISHGQMLPRKPGLCHVII